MSASPTEGTDMNQIEKVARALCDDAGCVWDHDPQALSRAEWRKAACAAIAAMQSAPQKPVGSAAEITRLTEALRAAEERVKALREALAWYGEKAAGCRRITREGDDARYALDRDRGERARQALAGAKPC